MPPLPPRPSASPPSSAAADVFSLGAVAFELLARRQLLAVGSSLADYESKVHSLTMVDMTGGCTRGTTGFVTSRLLGGCIHRLIS